MCRKVDGDVDYVERRDSVEGSGVLEPADAVVDTVGAPRFEARAELDRVEAMEHLVGIGDGARVEQPLDGQAVDRRHHRGVVSRTRRRRRRVAVVGLNDVRHDGLSRPKVPWGSTQDVALRCALAMM